MFGKVVWATDGSPAADLALSHSKTLVTDSGGELLIVHCEEFTAPRGKLGSLPTSLNEPDRLDKISRQAAELEDTGIRTELRVLPTAAGDAAHAIAELARDEHADVIVVGTRGRTPLGGLLLGSVTQRLLHLAPCSVLAVPPANTK